MKKEKIDESNYIQQHLANERTFLAWLRTSIAIVGIGFLSVSLHFNYGSHVSKVTDTISIVMMIFAIMVGIFVLFVGAISYQPRSISIIINDGGFYYMCYQYFNFTFGILFYQNFVRSLTKLNRILLINKRRFLK